jgi:hypothetical protein
MLMRTLSAFMFLSTVHNVYYRCSIITHHNTSPWIGYNMYNVCNRPLETIHAILRILSCIDMHYKKSSLSWIGYNMHTVQTDHFETIHTNIGASYHVSICTTRRLVSWIG